MAKRKSTARDENVENAEKQAALREKVVKLHFTVGELRQIRLGAVITDERLASFIRSAALARAKGVLRKSGLAERLGDDDGRS